LGNPFPLASGKSLSVAEATIGPPWTPATAHCHPKLSTRWWVSGYGDPQSYNVGRCYRWWGHHIAESLKGP